MFYKIREKEILLRNLFDNALNPIMVFDAISISLDANRAAQKIFEAEIEEIVEKTIWNLFSIDENDFKGEDDALYIDSKVAEFDFYIHEKKRRMKLMIIPMDGCGRKIFYAIGKDGGRPFSVDEQRDRLIQQTPCCHRDEILFEHTLN
ncbi:MAG: PAS domain S-box protein [Methanomassiliicoccales archaeon]|nr:PAS domain S-box protein [Methanomassiliicoccales archaeon]